jgi:hypothetical protein
VRGEFSELEMQLLLHAGSSGFEELRRDLELFSGDKAIRKWIALKEKLEYSFNWRCAQLIIPHTSLPLSAAATKSLNSE